MPPFLTEKGRALARFLGREKFEQLAADVYNRAFGGKSMKEIKDHMDRGVQLSRTEEGHLEITHPEGKLKLWAEDIQELYNYIAFEAFNGRPDPKPKTPIAETDD